MKNLFSYLTIALVSLTVISSCKNSKEQQLAPTKNSSNVNATTSVSNETFTCVSALNKTQEIELTITRGTDGAINITRVIRPISEGMNTRFYSLDNNIIDTNSGYGTLVDNSDNYIFIPFEPTKEIINFDIPGEGGSGTTVVTVKCVCCASNDGSSNGCAANLDSGGKFINCYNSTGDCFTTDGTVDCSQQTSGNQPISMWGVLMKGTATNTTVE